MVVGQKTLHAQLTTETRCYRHNRHHSILSFMDFVCILSQTNTSLQKIYLEGDWIEIHKFRDSKVTELNLSRRGYGSASVIIIAELLKVRACRA